MQRNTDIWWGWGEGACNVFQGELMLIEVKIKFKIVY